MLTGIVDYSVRIHVHEIGNNLGAGYCFVVFGPFVFLIWMAEKRFLVLCFHLLIFVTAMLNAFIMVGSSAYWKQDDVLAILV